MEHILKLQLYHGTDFNIAQKICKEEFICKENLEHWLGNGIYFFTDESLAKWWTTKPSRKFGHDIAQSAIIKCDLEVNKENVLDITTIDGYNICLETFDYFWRKYVSKNPPVTVTDFRRLRCAFFDWVMKTQNIDVIIVSFHLPNQPYIKKIADLIFDKFNISYGEVQVCLKQDKQHLLTNKRIEQIL